MKRYRALLVDTIRTRKLQLFGHICRMPDDRLLKTLLFGMVEGQRRPGRPARRRIDDILKWCGKDLRDAASMTEDRTIRRIWNLPYNAHCSMLPLLCQCLPVFE